MTTTNYLVKVFIFNLLENIQNNLISQNLCEHDNVNISITIIKKKKKKLKCWRLY